MAKNGNKKWQINNAQSSALTFLKSLYLICCQCYSLFKTLTTSVGILGGYLAYGLTLLYFTFHGAERFPKDIQDQVILFINSLVAFGGKC